MCGFVFPSVVPSRSIAMVTISLVDVVVVVMPVTCVIAWFSSGCCRIICRSCDVVMGVFVCACMC